MFNLLRMDMYQMVKGRTIWIFAIIIALLSIGSVATLWFVATPEYAAMMEGTTVYTTDDPMLVGPDGSLNEGMQEYDPTVGAERIQSMSILQALGNIVVGSSMIALLVTLFAGLMSVNEFSSGYIKNILTARVSRASFFASKIITIVVATFVLTMVGVLVSLLAFAVAGLQFSAVPIGEIVLWVVAIVLLVSAMSILIALVGWLSRNKAVTVVVAIFVATGMLVGLIGSALSLFPALPPITSYSLFATLSSITTGLSVEGAASLVQIFAVGIGFFVIYSLLSYLVIQKRDV